jgi:hypothetical protein
MLGNGRLQVIRTAAFGANLNVRRSVAGSDPHTLHGGIQRPALSGRHSAPEDFRAHCDVQLLKADGLHGGQESPCGGRCAQVMFNLQPARGANAPRADYKASLHPVPAHASGHVSFSCRLPGFGVIQSISQPSGATCLAASACNQL